jgi:hypothetical protein
MDTIHDTTDTDEPLTRARRAPARHGPGSRRWGRIPRLTAASAAVVALSLAGAGVAGAATTGSSGSTSAHPAGGPPGGGTPPTAAGKVTSVGTDTFTLTGRNGTAVTVDVGSTTTYRDPKVTSPTLADVTTGAFVAVVGTETSGTVTATTVLIGAPGPGGGNPGKAPTGKHPTGKPPTGKPSGTPPSGSAPTGTPPGGAPPTGTPPTS